MAGVLLVPACSDDGGGLAACPDVGDVLTAEMAEDGCSDDGQLTLLGVWECDDGRHLLGDQGMWGWVGEPVRESDGEVAADPAYQSAYDECFSG